METGRHRARNRSPAGFLPLISLTNIIYYQTGCLNTLLSGKKGSIARYGQNVYTITEYEPEDTGSTTKEKAQDRSFHLSFSGDSMRKAFASVIMILTAVLCVCIFFARRSIKPIGRNVAALIAALIPPMIGNLLIIMTQDHLVADIGSYMYFIGMDLIMFFMARFTIRYCNIERYKPLLYVIYLLLAADAIQLLINPVFNHAFDHEAIEFDGAVHWRLVPYMGQTFHRVVIYAVLAILLIRYTVMTVRSPRVDAERYFVILLAMIVTALWQTFYIFSRTPIDRSMIGLGVFGLLIFYFALYYRPVRLLNRMMAGIVGEMPEALFFFDTNGKCIWANEPGVSMTGILPGEFPAAKEALEKRFGDVDMEDEWTRRFVEGRGENARYFLLQRKPVQDRRTPVVGSFLRIRDDTEEQRKHARERFLATHDPLTGLYNREFLYEQIRHLLSSQPDRRWLIIFHNIKNFKIVNDVFGNEFGDHVLRRVAAWISEDMPEDTVYGRLAGDTFGVCMPADQFDEELIERALTGAVIRQDSFEYAVQIHLGIYEVVDPEMDVSVMFDRARLALSTIQDNYQKHVAWYGEEMRTDVIRRQQLSGQLTDAIAKQQIVPFLQPVTDRNGTVVGAEALVRWIHPERGLLSPAVFVPVFEENGMIAEMDRSMWRSACEILARWNRDHPELFLSVNISPKDFYFVDVSAEIRNLVKEFGLAPEKLRLEITETVMMTDEEKHLAVINELRSAGFLVEMDDFGSGYSSMNMLKDIPLDALKIDMKFLSRSSEETKTRRILQMIVGLAEDLGLVSVIEGVETEEQYRLLAGMGCRLFQGYYIARPMDVDSFEAFLEQRTGLHQ